MRRLRWVVPWATVVVALLAVVVWSGVGGALAGARDADVILARPRALVLLPGCLLLAWVAFHLRERRAPSLAFPRVADAHRTRPGLVSWLAPVPHALRVVALGLVVLALARPQRVHHEVTEVEGIDIMLVLDISQSMDAKDLAPDRLHAAQRTIRRFLEGRRGDRVGVTLFARDAMIVCPLTLDLAAVDRIVAGIAIGDLPPRGTAIGDGLGLGLAALRRSDARSRVAILLTDGDWNVQVLMNPVEAKRLAIEMGVRVFTVLVGSASPLAAGVRPAQEAHSTNPALLDELARETGGRYFQAGDDAALARGFDEVRSTLEKSQRRESARITAELFPRLLHPALFLVGLELLLGMTRLRRFP